MTSLACYFLGVQRSTEGKTSGGLLAAD